MKLRVTTTFIDKQAKDPADAEIQAGRTITVSQERGGELIAAGVAVSDEAKTATARKSRSRKPAYFAPGASTPAPRPADTDTDTGSTTA